MSTVNEVSKQEFDVLAKSVAEVAELAKKSKAENEENIARVVKEALENHPGFTPERKVKMEGAQKVFSPEMVKEEIVESASSEVKKEMDNLYVLSKLTGKSPRKLKSWGHFQRVGGDFLKAMEAATSGQGSEWVPTGFSSDLKELVRVSGKVVPLFNSFDMPTNPYKLPIQVGRLTTFKHDEQTADTGQTKIPVSDTANVTGNTTFTAKGHSARVLVSKDLEEDSIIPILPFLTKEIAKAIAEGREDAILNGDTAGTHEDSDTTSSSDRRKLFLGLRAAANDNSLKTDIGTLSVANLRTVRKKLAKFGINPAECAWIVGLSGYVQLLGLSEVITVDKYGPNATLLNGELAKFDGMPVIVSEYVRENLNASGVYDGTTTTKTVMYCVNRNGWAIGTRRGASVQLLNELYAESDQDALLVRERLDFQPIYSLASNPTTSIGYNLTA